MAVITLSSPDQRAVRALLAADLGDRSYATLSALEQDALRARIWSGLHVRDAMEDAYLVGHVTAERVVAELG